MAARKLTAQSPAFQSATPRAFGYVCVSTDSQADSGLSIDKQQTKIKARCVENGWQLKQRPEGDKLLRAVRPGSS